MRNERILLVLASAIAIFFLLIAGCSQPQAAPKASGSVPASIKDKPITVSSDNTNPLDYFPMDIGDEWTYTIIPGNANPVIHEKVYIVQDKEIYSFPYRQIIHTVPGQAYVLKIRVKGLFRGGQRPNSVELDVLQDDIGLFRDTTGVYWGMMDNPTGTGLQAMEQAASYSKESIAGVYHYSELDQATLIHSYRMIFIWAGSRIESQDGESVSYLGIDNNVPGYSGTPCYHFLREVPAIKSSVPGFYAFTEHTWYAKGKGMVRLEQKVDGQTSMVWTLDKFAPGGK